MCSVPFGTRREGGGVFFSEHQAHLLKLCFNENPCQSTYNLLTKSRPEAEFFAANEATKFFRGDRSFAAYFY